MIPTSVATLHRLLGMVTDGPRLCKNVKNPLLVDVVVIDEASMIDLEMMTNLVQALGYDTRLILIGDQNQLASVEAGSVLRDLCTNVGPGYYLPATQVWLRQLTGDQLPLQSLSAQGNALAQSTTILHTNHRFQHGGSIHALA